MARQDSDSERTADEIDRDLARFVDRAERMSGERNLRQHERNGWAGVAEALRGARYRTRLMMSDRTRKATAE